jgi:hypothetical protein
VTSDKVRVQIIDIGRDSDVDSLSLAAFKVGSVRPGPETVEPNAALMVSDDGEDLVVAWDLGGAVNYRQVEASGWSEPRVLTIDEHLTRDEAYQLLIKRLQQ